MEAIGGALGIVLCVGSIALIGKYVLGPTSERERTNKAITQFMLSDMLWLIVLLQLAMGGVVAVVPRDVTGAFRMALGLVFFLMLFLWWATMRMVSKNGVRSQTRRGMLIVVVVPVTLAMMVAWAPSCLIVATAVWLKATGVSHDIPLIMIQVAAVIAVVVFPLAWALRRATLWALDDPRAVPKQEEVKV